MILDTSTQLWAAAISASSVSGRGTFQSMRSCRFRTLSAFHANSLYASKSAGSVRRVCHVQRLNSVGLCNFVAYVGTALSRISSQVRRRVGCVVWVGGVGCVAHWPIIGVGFGCSAMIDGIGSKPSGVGYLLQGRNPLRLVLDVM